MGRMAGPDPLFRLHWSTFTGVDGRFEREGGDAPQYWPADRAGQRKTHRRQGGLSDGMGFQVGPIDVLRCSPNIFASPSEASKKEAVSTPSLVTGTSANDCVREGN